MHADAERPTVRRSGPSRSPDGPAVRLEAMYRAEFSRCVRVAAAVCGEPQAAVDVVQEAFAHALRSLDRYTEHGSFDSWVWAIVVNTARNHRRGANRRGQRVTDLPDDLPAPDDEPADVVAVRHAIRRLPERQRLMVFLRHYGDLSYGEIAKVVGVAPGTVASSLNHAHTTLKSRLEQEDTP